MARGNRRIQHGAQVKAPSHISSRSHMCTMSTDQDSSAPPFQMAAAPAAPLPRGCSLRSRRTVDAGGARGPHCPQREAPQRRRPNGIPGKRRVGKKKQWRSFCGSLHPPTLVGDARNIHPAFKKAQPSPSAAGRLAFR